MKNSKYTVVKNEVIAPGTYYMTVSGDTDEIKGPGQFINIKIDGLYLRRPMSICRADPMATPKHMPSAMPSEP